MQIDIINLATQPERWRLVEAQFKALGLKPCRLEAQLGGSLTMADTQRLYSERLNRRQYHKALSLGEIGCYASHLAAWQSMRNSARESVAVFEDDIDIDPDLPKVLDAIDNLSMNWDVIKLMGRAKERVITDLPLVGDRRLIEYARVPSRTGAYVLSRRGADKLLSRRVPFGRPVDVDLRHWWECDLDIFGVARYPVRPAAGSRVSSITDRHIPANFDMRVRKLSLQLQYTLLNWHATRVANRWARVEGDRAFMQERHPAAAK
jgi:glycosyl transferase family 25